MFKARERVLPPSCFFHVAVSKVGVGLAIIRKHPHMETLLLRVIPKGQMNLVHQPNSISFLMIIRESVLTLITYS